MPTLKQVTTAIELGPSNTRIREYDHRFTDGSVECFIVAPETDIPFHVRITTIGYIAPGLAAYVFIDGEYQCNRNRLCLEVPASNVDPAEYEIDFKLRQKEEKTSDGYFVVRDWFFTPLKTGVADGEPNMSSDWAKNVGTIEVVILRCKKGGEKDTAIDPAETVVATVPSAGRDMLQALSAKSKKPKQSAEKTWNAFKENTSKAPKENEAKDWKANTAKAPSKPASKVPSKQGSVVESLGGMFGIFDGAGDDPGYCRKFRPKNIVGQTFLPGHRFDDSTGRYRYYEDDDPFIKDDTRIREDRDHSRRQSESRYRPYTYTVGGEFEDDDRVPSTRSGPKRVAPRTSPSPTVDQRTRRRGVEFEIPTRSSTHQTTAHREHSRDEPQERRPSLPRSSVFIEEASNRMHFLQSIATEEAARYEALWEETNECKSDVVYVGMLTTLKRKYDEIKAMLAELRDLHDVIKACMEDMDRMEWKQTYDLLFEKGLLPPPKMDLSLPEGKQPDDEKQVGEKTDEQKQGEAPKADSWTAMGVGKVAEKKDEGNDNAWPTGNQNGQTDQVKNEWNQPDNKSVSTKTASEVWSADRKNNDNDNNNNNAGGDAWDAPAGDDNNNNDSWDKKSEKAKPRSYAAAQAKSHVSSASDREPHAEMKSYWKDWSKKPASAPKLLIPFRDPYKYPAPPTRPLPADRAKDIKHGVQTGRGADYAHKHYRPDYLDSMEKPYAVFTFKYRSKEALEKILKRKVDVGYVEEAVKGAEMERLMRTPKDELVAELLKRRGVPPTGGSRVSAAAEIKAAGEKMKAASNAGSNKGGNAGGWDDSPAAAPADDGWATPSDKDKAKVKNSWGLEITPKDSVSQAGRAKRSPTLEHWNANEPGMGTTKPAAGEPDGGAGGW